jgi:uncharacterized RDD family membrane protein YckC
MRKTMDDQAPQPAESVPASVAASGGAADIPGFWLRAGAYTIDTILLALASVLLSAVLPPVAGALARVLISAAYFIVWPIRAQGQTPGKMAAGLAIVRLDDEPLDYWNLIRRWLGYLLSGLTLCLGFICAAFTPRKRALHDYVAGTRVVVVAEVPRKRRIAVIVAGVLFPLLVLLGIAAAIVYPDLKGTAPEEAVKGRLAMLRSAAAMSYADAGGKNPASLGDLVPKYIPSIEMPGLPDHAAAGVETYGAEVCSGSTAPGEELVGAQLRDTGKWGYVVAPQATCDGTIFIDSTRADSTGRSWFTY